MNKEINIIPPVGFEIDKENSTFECIKFKPIKNIRWRDDENAKISGYYISAITADIVEHDNALNIHVNYHLFATEKQAKSALAVARISQIMANDDRFGGIVTDEEWENGCSKCYIERVQNRISKSYYSYFYNFLAFHAEKQRNLFLEENEDLIKDYLML